MPLAGWCNDSLVLKIRIHWEIQWSSCAPVGKKQAGSSLHSLEQTLLPILLPGSVESRCSPRCCF